MHDFFILKPAVNTKETGHAFPAVESYEDYDFKSPNSVHELKYGEFPSFEPDIKFKLAKGAKLCDVMSQATIAAHGLLISEKAKVVFSSINIIPHEYYEGYIEDHDKEIHKYFWMHLVWSNMAEYISYNDSSFFKRKFSNNLGELSIDSDDKFWKTKKDLGPRYMIGINKIEFKKELNYQLFIYPYSSNLLISASAIEEFELLSGLEIIPDDSVTINQEEVH